MIDLLVGRGALLVIDMQHDFVDLEAGCYNVGAEDTIAPTAAAIAAMRRAGLPVVWTMEAHRASGIDGGLENSADCVFAPHTVEGTRGIEIVPDLAPGPDDLVVRKRRYNCFLGTELDLLLKALRVDTLVVTGVSSDVCVHWTVGEAFQRDFHVRVLEDCVAGTTREDHEASLLIMRNLVSAGQRFVSADLTAALAAARRPADGTPPGPLPGDAEVPAGV
jgi:nicotinamidase-related amidase